MFYSINNPCYVIGASVKELIYRGKYTKFRLYVNEITRKKVKA